MGTNSDNRKVPLIDIAKAVGAILGVPLALFAVINGVSAQPITALIVALVTAVLASALVVYYDWSGITEMILAWLAIIVLVLAGFVIWPETMIVEGIISDTGGNPFSNETVLLIDVNGVTRQTDTDTEGYYQFKEVPTGPYKVRVSEIEGGGGAGGFFVRTVKTDLTVPVAVVVTSPAPTATEAPSPTPTPLPPPATTDTPEAIALDSPTPTPPPPPTDTPVPAPTDTPPPQPTDTPIPTSTHTPSPASPVSVLNVQDGDTVARSVSLVGEYAPNVTDDVWVLVGFPAGAPSQTVWPQSPNACQGESATKLNDRWEVRIGVGGPNDTGKLFEIIVTTTDEDAGRFLSQTLRTWCQNSDYPGLSGNELPTGLTQHQRITVRRGPAESEPHPDISSAELPGQVFLEGISDGDIALLSPTIGGTYSGDVADHIWAVVYAPDGRYYPQSINACEGISTNQVNGLWDVGINLGGDGDVGRPFDIIVVLVSVDVHAIFEARQDEGCRTGHFPGYLFIELPEGMDEKASVSVIRE
jgi:hypothetical protein